MSETNGFDVEKEAVEGLRASAREELMSISSSLKNVKSDGNRLANSVILEKHLKKLSNQLNWNKVLFKLLSPVLWVISIGLIYAFFTNNAVLGIFLGPIGIMFLIILDSPMTYFSSVWKKEKVMGNLLGETLIESSKSLRSARPQSEDSDLVNANIYLNALLVITQNDLINMSNEKILEQISRNEKAIFALNPSWSSIKIRSVAIQNLFQRVVKIYIWKVGKIQREDLSGVSMYLKFRKELKIREEREKKLNSEFMMKVIKGVGLSSIYQKVTRKFAELENEKQEKARALLRSQKNDASSLSENDKLFKDLLGDSGENMNKQFFDKEIK